MNLPNLSSSRHLVFLQFANVFAFVATVLVNSLANSTALNGKTTGEISDLHPTLITPAGYVFSIWGVIYTLLLIFVVYQAFSKQREKPFLHQVSLLFVLSCILNILWLFLWQYEQIVLSVLLMFALLATLIGIYVRLNIGRSQVSLKEKLAVQLPFSVYLGWISVASIANVAVALTVINWNGWGLSDVTWAVLVIIVALIINLTVIVTRRDVAYSLVIVWALVGIAVKQIENQSIVMITGVSATIIAVALVAVVVSSKLKQ